MNEYYYYGEPTIVKVLIAFIISIVSMLAAFDMISSE